MKTETLGELIRIIALEQKNKLRGLLYDIASKETKSSKAQRPVAKSANRFGKFKRG